MTEPIVEPAELTTEERVAALEAQVEEQATALVALTERIDYYTGAPATGTIDGEE